MSIVMSVYVFIDWSYMNMKEWQYNGSVCDSYAVQAPESRIAC